METGLGLQRAVDSSFSRPQPYPIRVFEEGCDRAIPNERRSRLPGLHNLRLLLLRPRSLSEN